MKRKNEDVLDSFVKYCVSHPTERFWQALRNWSNFAFIFAGYNIHTCDDTFYWEGRDK